MFPQIENGRGNPRCLIAEGRRNSELHDIRKHFRVVVATSG
jgi:hypothetical protein